MAICTYKNYQKIQQVIEHYASDVLINGKVVDFSKIQGGYEFRMKVPVPLSKEEKKEAKLMAVIVVLI